MMDRSENSEIESWCILTSPNTNPYLPPEVWAKIFRDLPTRDKLSVANTCLEWDELLSSEKTLALLEKVLPLLNLDEHNILALREVSQGTKQSVNSILETFAEQNETFSFNHEISERRRNFNDTLHQINNTYNFSSFFMDDVLHRSVQQFVNQMGENRRQEDNPFLTRSAIISFTDFEHDFTTAERMLTLFGHHLWSLTVNVQNNLDAENVQLEIPEDDEIAVTVPTRKLPRLLNLVPNLKNLSLFATFPRNVAVEELRLEALPELKNLQSLSFARWFNLPTLPLAFLRRYGRQLIRWTDSFCFTHSLLQMDILSIEVLNELLPNLKKLTISFPRYNSLRKLQRVNWKLKELKIEFLILVNNWRLLFNVIGNFSQTLVLLELGSGLHSMTFPYFPKDNFIANILELLLHSAPAMPKLQVLGLDSDFVNSDKCLWFCDSVRDRWRSLKELHVDTSLPRAGRNLHPWRNHWVFQKLPNLGRILNWSTNPQNHRKILKNVLTRPH